MRTMTLAILALFLGACENIAGPGGSGDADDCTTYPDGSTEGNCPEPEPVATGTLTVQPTIVDISSKDSVPIETMVNVYEITGADTLGDLVGTYPTGEAIELPVDMYVLYVLTIGDITEAGDATDDLPLYIDETGGMWISPRIERPEITEGSETVIDAPMNLFIEGEWTCYLDPADNFYTGDVSYEDGNSVYLPGLGDLIVNEMTLDDTDEYVNGVFIDATYAELTTSGGMAGDQIVECWAGNEDDRRSG